MNVCEEPINNTHISTATRQQIPTENTLEVASPARACCVPQLPVPSATAPKRCIRAPCRRCNQQEEEEEGKSFWPHFRFLYEYQNRKEEEDGATVRVSALPTPAVHQSGEPAQCSRAPFAWPLLNNIMLFDYVISLQHVSPKEPSTPLRGRIAAHAIHALTWGGLGNPMLPFLEKVDVNNKHTLCCSSTRLAAARQTCWRK